MNRITPKLLAPVLCLCLSAALPLTAGAANAGISGHWAEPALEDFIGGGYVEENCNPDSAMTQAQLASMLQKLTGKSAAPASDAAISRQDAAVMVAEALGLTSGQTDLGVLSQFSDSGDISESARQSVAAMVNADYIHGTTEGTFLPADSLTLAEGVTILSNALGALRVNAADTLYGTASLTYAEYYSGDVTTLDGYGVDGVSSATLEKHVSFNNGMYTDYTEENTDGYHILGVKNVNVAVSAADYEAYLAINPSFKVTASTPAQYKTVTLEGGKAVYSATNFQVVDTITDATAVLKTGTAWGDYEIDITENSTSYIRNNRSDEGWAINAYVQGVILETSEGRKVGMEYLQSMWVQPWEVSFNVSADSTMNAHIAGWDNLSELSGLVGTTITSVTYIMPDSTYVYQFSDGIYIKPVYSGSETVSASFTDGSAQVAVTGIPAALEDVTVTVAYGSGRRTTTVADSVPVVNGSAAMTETYDSDQTYTVKISSSNYADIVAAVPMSEAQRTQLNVLVESAKSLIDDGPAANDSGLIEHYEEALELLADGSATTADAAELITELTSHLSVYVASEEPAQSGHGH